MNEIWRTFMASIELSFDIRGNNPLGRRGEAQVKNHYF